MKPVIFLLIMLTATRVLGTPVKSPNGNYNITIDQSNIVLTKNGKMISSFPFAFSYKDKEYKPLIRKAIPVDLDEDSTDEIILQLDNPDMLSPNIVLLYIEADSLKKLHEGISLVAIPYANSGKTDVHTLTIGADLVMKSKEGKTINDRLVFLDRVEKQKLGIVMFPKFIHMQIGTLPFLVDARHFNYTFDNCEKISFGNLTSIQLSGIKQLLQIYQNLLTIIDIQSIDKAKGSLEYGFFTVEYKDNVKAVNETKDQYLIEFMNGNKKTLDKKEIHFNYRKEEQWFR